MVFEKAEVVFTPAAEGYKVENDTVGGEDVTLDAMTPDEVARFHDDYVNLVNQYKENLFSSNASICQLLLNVEDLALQVVRVVKRHAERPYQGRAAEGNGVILDAFAPEDFYPSAAGPPVVAPDWLRAIAGAPLASGWIQSTTVAGQPFVVHRNAGFMIAGYANMSPTSLCRRVRYQKQARNIPYKELNFYAQNIIPEQVPIQVLPEASILGTVWYFTNGTDGLMPIGIKVVTADRVGVIAAGVYDSPLEA